MHLPGHSDWFIHKHVTQGRRRRSSPQVSETVMEEVLSPADLAKLRQCGHIVHWPSLAPFGKALSESEANTDASWVKTWRRINSYWPCISLYIQLCLKLNYTWDSSITQDDFVTWLSASSCQPKMSELIHMVYFILLSLMFILNLKNKVLILNLRGKRHILTQIFSNIYSTCFKKALFYNY